MIPHPETCEFVLFCARNNNIVPSTSFTKKSIFLVIKYKFFLIVFKLLSLLLCYIPCPFPCFFSMSSFHFGPVLPVILVEREHNELLRKWLLAKPQNSVASGCSKTCDFDDNSSDDDLPKSMFCVGKDDSKVPSDTKPSDGITTVDELVAACSTKTLSSVAKPKLSGQDKSLNADSSAGVANINKSEAEWRDPITMKEFCLKKLQEAIAKKEKAHKKRSEKFRPGHLVSCRRKKILQAVPHGIREDGKNSPGLRFWALSSKDLSSMTALGL